MQAEIIDFQELKQLYSKGNIDLIVVLGPTASGKTRYAVSLANSLGDSEIISADSRQVYKDMNIGTGKDIIEYGSIPYHLIDIVPAGSQYNVYSFQQDFLKSYSDILSRNKIPLLCGGSGMYITAICSGYDFHSKTALSQEKPKNNREGFPHKPFIIGTLVDRETRNMKIDARLDARLNEGMVEEVQGLINSGIDPSVLIGYGLEYKFVTLYLQGELTYSQMKEKLSIAIHQFAKRQMTWFRGMERSGLQIHWTEVSL